MSRVAWPEWPAPAWGAIGVTSLFIAITCWWLSQDHTIPVFDAGLHLVFAVDIYHEIGAGHLGEALTRSVPYPPFAYLIASLGMLIGGLGVAPPIIAENLFFVTLLALGCYKVGRMAFGPMAGLLAVVFALGAPLIIAQYHVFMTDAPETAMVAVSVWLIISTDGFSQLGRSAVAGVAVGLGMLTKEPFAIFVVGIVATTLWRGGWQSWRGFALFSAIALVIALPWYIDQWNQIQTIGNEASSTSSTFNQYRIPDVAPPRLSPTNLEWYLWSMINSLLYLPLFLFAAVGWVWAVIRVIRRQPVSRLAPELLIGAFLSWGILTETFIHDERYCMPLLIYLAVFGSCWIVRLAGRWRIVAAAALVLVALANTLGTTFGVGGDVKVLLPGSVANTLQQPGSVRFYSNAGFLVGGPNRDGDLPEMLGALYRSGVRGVYVVPQEAYEPDFSEAGVFALAMMANLKTLNELTSASQLTSQDAVLFHEKPRPNRVAPCVTLADGTGVWIVLGNPNRSGVQYFCPLSAPR